MIIGLSGRINSGKSYLANICIENGYEKIYFALPLKRLVAGLIGVNVEEINKLKYVEKDYNFMKMDYIFLARETGIPYKTIEDEMSKVKFTTVRQLLQFIGTDIIRKYNTNWHVNRIREMLKPDVNYVIDDVRFPNEMNLIKELGGDCWYIVRPDLSKISNHESETSLKWQDFGNNVIINDGGINAFKFKWEVFIKNYGESKKARDKYISSKCVSELYKDVAEDMSVFDLLELSKWWFEYKPREFDCENIKNVTEENRVATIEYNDGTFEKIVNPLNIEDLKLCIN